MVLPDDVVDRPRPQPRRERRRRAEPLLGGRREEISHRSLPSTCAYGPRRNSTTQSIRSAVRIHRQRRELAAVRLRDHVVVERLEEEPAVRLPDPSVERMSSGHS